MKAVMIFVIAIAVAALPRPASAQRGPDVVIIAEEDKMIYEFRQNGELRMIRIVPTFGKPYYLVPTCLLYTSPSPRDRTRSRMPSSA